MEEGRKEKSPPGAVAGAAGFLGGYTAQVAARAGARWQAPARRRIQAGESKEQAACAYEGPGFCAQGRGGCRGMVAAEAASARRHGEPILSSACRPWVPRPARVRQMPVVVVVVDARGRGDGWRAAAANGELWQDSAGGRQSMNREQAGIDNVSRLQPTGGGARMMEGGQNRGGESCSCPRRLVMMESEDGGVERGCRTQQRPEGSGRRGKRGAITSG